MDLQSLMPLICDGCFQQSSPESPVAAVQSETWRVAVVRPSQHHPRRAYPGYLLKSTNYVQTLVTRCGQGRHIYKEFVPGGPRRVIPPAPASHLIASA